MRPLRRRAISVHLFPISACDAITGVCVCARARVRMREPSPTLSPTDPVPRGLLTLRPAASSGPQGLYTAYIQPIYSVHVAVVYAW